jgi:hypothetical protein
VDPVSPENEGLAEEAGRRDLWVMAVFERRKRQQIYVHLSAIRRPTDYALFCGLRQKYFQVSSRWRRFLRMRGVTAVRFVKVSNAISTALFIQATT